MNSFRVCKAWGLGVQGLGFLVVPRRFGSALPFVALASYLSVLLELMQHGNPRSYIRQTQKPEPQIQ